MKLIEDESLDILTAADDDFHQPERDRWAHETSWFWWYVPQESIGGWAYHWVRPNIGVSGGGVWVWDASTTSYFEAPYFTNYSNQPLEAGRDLRNHQFASGLNLRMVEPLHKYELTFRDRDLLSLDLVFESAMPPWVGSLVGDPPHAIHFDQFGRVTGKMTLHGSTYHVDCVASRDRSWHTRDERWKRGSIGYCDAANDSADVAFLAISGRAFVPSALDAHRVRQEEIHSGYLVRDSRRFRLVGGSRSVQRDTETGCINQIAINGVDSKGRTLAATGIVASRIAIPNPGVHGVVWTTLIRWTFDDGTIAWGQDQDAWPIQQWSAFRRAARSVE
jgi:hypothetical protein